MARRYISQFGEREAIDQVFLASEKQLRANRNGNLYLQLRLADRSGSLTAMLWNANDQVYGSFENGDYLRVQGTTQFYNGALQMIASHIDRVDAAGVDEADFTTLSNQQLESLIARLAELLRSMRNVHLRNLAECFLMDETFMQQFTSAPAGIKNHHAYRGGLLDHVVSLMELVHVVGPRYEALDQDLLMMGAFLHDVGKIHELCYERQLEYSDQGQLLGHVVLGLEIVAAKAQEAERLAGESFPPELLLQLKHLIVSHHGEYEFGSPKLPMTVEAIALHLLDTLDARVHSISAVIREDANSESCWTTYQPHLGRKLFKGNVV